jgi:chromosome segregation ATPase
MNESMSQKEIQEMDSKIAALKERAKLTEGEAKKALSQQMRAIEDQFELLKARMGRTEAKAKTASQELAQGAQRAWDELKDSVEKASRSIH